MEVCAPIDGQLGELNIEIGQYISSGTQIGKINVLGKYKVTALIDEHYIDRVRKDLEATLERQGKDFNMKVIKVYPDVKEGQFKTDLEFTEEIPDNIRTRTDIPYQFTIRSFRRIDIDSPGKLLPKYRRTMGIRAYARW